MEPSRNRNSHQYQQQRRRSAARRKAARRRARLRLYCGLLLAVLLCFLMFLPGQALVESLVVEAGTVPTPQMFLLDPEKHGDMASFRTDMTPCLQETVQI